MADLRACFLGDSYVTGAGDDSALGWVGRVAVAARSEGVDLTPYTLGVRYETGPEVADRALAEMRPRLKHGDRFAAMVAFGANDISQGIPLADTLAAAGTVLEAAAGLDASAFVLSPPVFGMDLEKDAKAAEMTAGLQGLCAARATPFLNLRDAVADWSLWWAEAQAGDGAHPNAAGYALVADAVSAWGPWRAWLGLSAK